MKNKNCDFFTDKKVRKQKMVKNAKGTGSEKQETLQILRDFKYQEFRFLSFFNFWVKMYIYVKNHFLFFSLLANSSEMSITGARSPTIRFTPGPDSKSNIVKNYSNHNY